MPIPAHKQHKQLKKKQKNRLFKQTTTQTELCTMPREGMKSPTGLSVCVWKCLGVCLCVDGDGAA